MMKKRLPKISNLKSLLAVLAIMLFTITALAQSTVKGKVVDAVTKESLPGAAVSIKGTTTGTITNAEGEFTLKIEKSTETLVVNYVGYKTQEVSVQAKGNGIISDIKMESNATSMSEIVVVANSLAIDRKTPIAVSTISAAFIEEKGSNQEFPELLKSTPGVYATRAGGGYGDSRMNLRGFQSENIAVLINGVPVNGMENGKVYWSNWAGLSDVTRSMQVQRGLGASKVAVPSVGGTINIQTKTLEAIKGGTIFQGIGNNGYSKTTFSYSSGLMDKGWAFSLLGSKIKGDGWVEGTEFDAYNYFINISKRINDDHTLSLTAFGAPQTHAQRFDRLTIQEYRDAPQGIRYNPNWGVLNGQKTSISQNTYHKPQISLNHNWTINETSFLSTAVYASLATGGGTNDGGSSINFDDYRTNGAYSPINLDAVVQENLAQADGKAVGFLRTSVNDHKWFGLLSTYTKKVNDKFDVLAGVDGRYYRGKHYMKVNNLLGAKYVADNTNINNPYNQAKTGDKFSFDNDGEIGWGGLFVQTEYNDGPLSAFLSLSGSNTSYRRIDYFKFLDSDPNQKSEWVNIFGYQTKGGANYNLNDHHNVFANVGYFEKAPFFNAVFMNNSNNINREAEREKIASFELGYGYRSSVFTANINAYYTQWKDKSFTRSFTPQGSSEILYGNFTGVDALHTGIELDFKYKPVAALTVTGMASIGNWKWKNNLPSLDIFNEAQEVVNSYGPVYMKDVEVGDSPQTTFALGVNYDLFSNFKIGVDYNYYTDFFTDFNATTLLQPDLKPWRIPTYSLVDVNAVFKMKIAGLNASLFANVNNLLDTEYISDGFANFSGERTLVSDANNSTVYFGTGRTWTTGLKVNF
jgi:iron complex outermembrane receptor protein